VLTSGDVVKVPEAFAERTLHGKERV